VVERHRDRAPEDPDGQQCHDDDEPKAHRVHTVPDAFSRVKDSTKFLRHPAMALNAVRLALTECSAAGSVDASVPGPSCALHAVRSPAAGDGHGTQTPRQPR
jgi:hypothetical protein